MEDGTELDPRKDAPSAGTHIKVTVTGKGGYTGTASVTIKGVGDYAGEKTVKFKIKSKTFKWF